VARERVNTVTHCLGRRAGRAAGLGGALSLRFRPLFSPTPRPPPGDPPLFFPCWPAFASPRAARRRGRSRRRGGHAGGRRSRGEWFVAAIGGGGRDPEQRRRPGRRPRGKKGCTGASRRRPRADAPPSFLAPRRRARPARSTPAPPRPPAPPRAAPDADAASAPAPVGWKGARPAPLAASLALGLAVRFLLPIPAGLTPDAWSLLAVFTTTIAGLVLEPLPTGAWACVCATGALASGAMSFAQAFSAFRNDVIWLIVVSFFFAAGFQKTGLGERVANIFVRAFGASSLGLAYGLAAAEACLAPAMPSTTARAGGVFMPIIDSLARGAGSLPSERGRGGEGGGAAAARARRPPRLSFQTTPRAPSWAPSSSKPSFRGRSTRPPSSSRPQRRWEGGGGGWSDGARPPTRARAPRPHHGRAPPPPEPALHEAGRRAGRRHPGRVDDLVRGGVAPRARRPRARARARVQAAAAVRHPHPRRAQSGSGSLEGDGPALEG